MTSKKSYLGNTVTAEEAELLATLPEAEANALHEKILKRTVANYPAVEERMGGSAGELLEAIEARESSPHGNQDLTSKEEELARLISDSGFGSSSN